jgi:hypothetical protein
MSIEKQYYLNCNSCGHIYESKADDAQGLEEEAIDDGWSIDNETGYDGNGECLNSHLCPSCNFQG